MLKYLGRDPENLCERTRDNHFERYIRLKPVAGRAVHVHLEFAPTRVKAGFRQSLTTGEVRELRTLIEHMLGLDQPLEKFYRIARKQKVMAPIIKRHRGARIPRLPDLWETLCWAILGQQINLAFAYRLRNRLIQTAHPVQAKGGVRAFPTPEQVLAIRPAALRKQQFSAGKITYLHELARAFSPGSGRLAPHPEIRAGGVKTAEDARVFRENLLAIKGIGPWSVDYALMRCGGYLDALPVGDAGLRAALKKAFGLEEAPGLDAQEELMEPFRPYRSLATYYLWKSLEP